MNIVVVGNRAKIMPDLTTIAASSSLCWRETCQESLTAYTNRGKDDMHYVSSYRVQGSLYKGVRTRLPADIGHYFLMVMP